MIKTRPDQPQKLWSSIHPTRATATMAEMITRNQFWIYSTSVITFLLIVSRLGTSVLSLPYAAFNFGIWSTICMLGVTLGYHRYFSHRAFQASRPLKISLAIASLLSCQGTIAHWVARHRLHHRYADSALDPHSPFESNPDGNCGHRATVRSFLWSHWTWQFKDKKHVVISANKPLVEIPTRATRDNFEYTKELKADMKLKKFGVQPFHWYSKTITEDSTVNKLDKLYPIVMLLSIALPIALSIGLWLIDRVHNMPSQFANTTLIESTLSGFFWGFLARLIAVQELTNSINSISHLFGYRSKKSEDSGNRIAKNIPILGIVNFGEGFHSNHHDEPGNPNFSRRWHEIDLAYQLLRFLSFVGIAKLPITSISRQDISGGRPSQATANGGQ